MDFNGKNLSLERMGTRLEQQIKFDEILVNFVVKPIQENQASPPIASPFKEQARMIDLKGITFFLSLPLFLLTLGLFLKIAGQKISKNHLIFEQSQPKRCCRQCQFFNNNHYLKCAVHPDKVLKQEAKDCRDYQGKGRCSRTGLHFDEKSPPRTDRLF